MMAHRRAPTAGAMVFIRDLQKVVTGDDRLPGTNTGKCTETRPHLIEPPSDGKHDRLLLSLG